MNIDKLAKINLEINQQIENLYRLKNRNNKKIDEYKDICFTKQVIPHIPKILQNKIKIITHELCKEKDDDDKKRHIKTYCIKFKNSNLIIIIRIDVPYYDFDIKNMEYDKYTGNTNMYVSINDIICEIEPNKIFIDDEIKQHFVSILSDIKIPFTFTNLYRLYRMCEIILLFDVDFAIDDIEIRYESYQQYLQRAKKDQN